MKYATMAFGAFIVLSLPCLSFGASPEEAISALKQALHPGVLHGISQKGAPCSVETIHDVENTNSISVILREKGSNDPYPFFLSSRMENKINRFDDSDREVKVQVVGRQGMSGLTRVFIGILKREPGIPALVSISFGAGMGSPYLGCQLK